MGGLGTIEDINNSYSDLGKTLESGVDIDSVKDFLASAKKLCTEISKITPREWPMTLQPVVYALKDANDITIRAIDTISARTQSSMVKPQDSGSPSGRFGDEFNRVFSRGSARINSFISSFGGNGGNPSSYLDNARISLYTLDSRIKNLESMIQAIKNEENADSLAKIESELNGIKEMVDGRIKTLETKQSLTGEETRSIIRGAEDQTSKLEALKSRFFNEFSSVIRKSESESVVNSILEEAENKIKQAEEIITTRKEASKVFQGFERSGLDDKIDKTVQGIRNQTQSGTSGQGGQSQSPVDRTNRRKIKVDDLSDYIGVPSGEYNVPSAEIDRLLGNN